jgi:superfamily II DNA/RNA helicase
MWHIQSLYSRTSTDILSKLSILIKGLRQYYIKLHEDEKNQKLIDLLGKLEFNQAVIFVKSVSRCNALCQLLIKENFPAIEIHQDMTQEQRYVHFQISIK